MSFAADVKKELTGLEVHREHAKAELAALLRMNGSLGIVNQQFILNVQTENAAIARRIYSLLKDHYQVRSELLVRKKMKLKKNNVYIVRLKQGTKDVLMDLDIMDGMMFNGHVSDEIMGNSQKCVLTYVVLLWPQVQSIIRKRAVIIWKYFLFMNSITKTFAIC
jgi:cell division protein WhiA